MHEPKGETKNLPIGKTEQQVTKLGSQLSPEEEKLVTDVICKNKDLFSWTTVDMPNIHLEAMSHKLAIFKEARTVAQKKRKMGEERRQVVESEVKKLLEAGFIREVKYTMWLANMVMVKKSSGKWRMCTDFTDLNKAYPKGAYPLPSIDRLIDGASDHKVLSFLDAYSRDNQIPMYAPDRTKTTFITDQVNYYYDVIPFGLKTLRLLINASWIESSEIRLDE